ncbi:MAG: hypothetical protein V4467_00320 [Patescibacteria group bacterium]
MNPTVADVVRFIAENAIRSQIGNWRDFFHKTLLLFDQIHLEANLDTRTDLPHELVIGEVSARMFENMKSFAAGQRCREIFDFSLLGGSSRIHPSLSGPYRSRHAS